MKISPYLYPGIENFNLDESKYDLIKKYFEKYNLKKKGKRSNEYIGEMRKVLIIKLSNAGLHNDKIAKILFVTRANVNHRLNSKEASKEVKDLVGANMYKWIEEGLYPESCYTWYAKSKNLNITPDEILKIKDRKNNIRSLTLIKL